MLLIFKPIHYPPSATHLPQQLTLPDRLEYSGPNPGGNMGRFRMSNAALAALLCVLALAGSGWAHHSIQSQFDIHKTISISGSVAKIEWINPHSYLTVNVKDADGKVQKWAFELGGPGVLRRAGLSRADRGGLKAGDQITVTALAARDGSNSGFVQEVRVSDGRVFKLATDANGQ
jgi:Family of unknown function (DUF6152)